MKVYILSSSGKLNEYLKQRILKIERDAEVCNKGFAKKIPAGYDFYFIHVNDISRNAQKAEKALVSLRKRAPESYIVAIGLLNISENAGINEELYWPELLDESYGGIEKIIGEAKRASK